MIQKPRKRARKLLWIPFVINLFVPIHSNIRSSIPTLICFLVSLYFAFKCLYQGRQALDETLEAVGITKLARLVVVLAAACLYWFSLSMWMGPFVDASVEPLDRSIRLAAAFAWMIPAALISGLTFFESE